MRLVLVYNIKNAFRAGELYANEEKAESHPPYGAMRGDTGKGATAAKGTLASGIYPF
jgi:hypothetical protein